MLSVLYVYFSLIFRVLFKLAFQQIILQITLSKFPFSTSLLKLVAMETFPITLDPHISKIISDELPYFPQHLVNF